MSTSAMGRAQWLDALREANAEFIEQLQLFGPEEINAIPYEGSWTVGQVAQHVYKSDKGMLLELSGSVKKEERRPDQFVNMISSVFLDFESKLESPAFIIPEIRDYEKDFIISRFKLCRSKMAEVVQTADLSETCTAFPFPGLGELTRMEIISFIIAHTRRHSHQLKKIARHLNGNDPFAS